MRATVPTGTVGLPRTGTGKGTGSGMGMRMGT
jgi:hypothetical protein